MNISFEKNSDMIQKVDMRIHTVYSKLILYSYCI